MNLKYLSVQPASDYYAWQVEVYIKNFLEMGVPENLIHVLAAYEVKIPKNWLTLMDTFPDVNFFFYRDTRNIKVYAPSVQAHLLRKHFDKFPELENDAIFFHDCDFTFTRPFDFTSFLHNDTWYFSDTISYIGADYINTKSPELLEIMCDLVGIEKQVVEDNQNNSGGAQKLMKGLTADYWRIVEEDSIKLYTGLGDLQKHKSLNDPHVLQIWCASMWAELWGAWKAGFEVMVPTDFNFSFATDPISKWNTNSFFHNAGVVDNESGMFYKADYITKLPYKENLELDKTKCSYLYFNQVVKAGKNSNLIIGNYRDLNLAPNP